MSAFLKANYHTLLELVMAAGLLGTAILLLLAGAMLRWRWAGILAVLFSGAAGLPIVLLSHLVRLKTGALALGCLALLLGAIGAWVGMRPASRPPQERIRRRKRKQRS